jgi:hypothetical protein
VNAYPYQREDMQGVISVDFTKEVFVQVAKEYLKQTGGRGQSQAVQRLRTSMSRLKEEFEKKGSERLVSGNEVQLQKLSVPLQLALQRMRDEERLNIVLQTGARSSTSFILAFQISPIAQGRGSRGGSAGAAGRRSTTRSAPKNRAVRGGGRRRSGGD